jgi:hypothetical protein
VNEALASRVKKQLTEYYFKHADNAAIDYVDNLMADGVRRTAFIDTVTGRIKLDKSLLDPKWSHLHDGYLMEELQHFHQLHSRGWLGRILSPAENILIENEVVRRLLKSGLAIFN